MFYQISRKTVLVWNLINMIRAQNKIYPAGNLELIYLFFQTERSIFNGSYKIYEFNFD